LQLFKTARGSDPSFKETIYRIKVLWNDGPSKGELSILSVQDIRLVSPVSIEAHPVIQFLQRALEENKKNGEAGDVRTSMPARVSNNDHVLKSSVENVSNVRSSDTCKNAFLIRLKQYENEGSTSLSRSGNSNFQHENVQKNITNE
jgi:hypothetical protein